MEKPIVLVIMDGVGKGDGGSGDAVVVANTPTLCIMMSIADAICRSIAGRGISIPIKNIVVSRFSISRGLSE